MRPCLKQARDRECGRRRKYNDYGRSTALSSVLDGLNLDTAIRLRWALRDIKAGRMKLSPVSQNDLMALIELGLIEMQDDVSQLTYEGSSRDRLELKDIDGTKTEPPGWSLAEDGRVVELAAKSKSVEEIENLNRVLE